MNPTCEYCGTNPIAENYYSTCEFCIYQCSTCGADTPYEDGVSDSGECGVCDTGSGMDARPLEIRTDADMTDQTPIEQGDPKMKNTLYTVVSFDDQTEMYQVVGTTTSDIEPNEMVQLLGKQDEQTEFENVIADFINREVEQMVALAVSKKRASSSRMTRAEHKQVFMRMGEWNSLIFALEKIDRMEVRPHNDINNGVSVETLIDIIKSSVETSKGVIGNA